MKLSPKLTTAPPSNETLPFKNIFSWHRTPEGTSIRCLPSAVSCCWQSGWCSARRSTTTSSTWTIPRFVSLNSQVTGGLTAEAVKWAFTHCYGVAYMPVTWITHMLDCQFYGLDAGGHHLTNVLLHAATAVLLFLVLRQMTGRLWPSAFVAAVFAIHPLRVESVAWVTERKDVLSGLFFVLALGAYVGYVRHRFSFIRYLIVMVLFALGLMAKPMLVTLPFVLLLLDYWPLGRITAAATEYRNPDWGGNVTATSEPMAQPWLRQEAQPPLRWSLGTAARLVLEKVPLLALTAVFCVVTLACWFSPWSSGSYGVDLLDQRFPLSWRIGNVPISYVSYLGMFFYPVGLAVPYPRPGLDLSFWKVFGAVMVLVVLTSATLVWRRRCPYLLVGWLWYLGMLVPVSGFLQYGYGDDGRPFYVLAANRAVHCPDMGIGRCVEVFAVSVLGVRCCRGVDTRGPDGMCMASNVFLARQRDAVEPHASLHFAEQCGPSCPWQHLSRPRPD